MNKFYDAKVIDKHISTARIELGFLRTDVARVESWEHLLERLDRIKAILDKIQ